jgi:hypothetical protein
MSAKKNSYDYARFDAARSEFRARVAAWTAEYPALPGALRKMAKARGYDYPLETPIVYNSSLDLVGEARALGIVLVADNPGLNEQRADRRAYLVGQSGKLAEGFFSRELGMDFRRDALILNKTPVHTPKTRELADLVGQLPGLRGVSFMAHLAVEMALALSAEIWVCGYSELGPRGLFSAYAEALREEAERAPLKSDKILVFKHFSMNQFSHDYKVLRAPGEGPMQALRRIGASYRAEKLLLA